jgi:hypothetical protein
MFNRPLTHEIPDSPLDEGELRCPVDGDEHVQLAFFGAHLGDIDMEVADRIALEAGFGLLTLDSGQA